MKSGEWTPVPDLDVETVIQQQNNGTATIFVSLDGLVVAHLDIVPVPDDERPSIEYAVEIDAYAYMTDAFEGEVYPTRIHVHAFRQSATMIEEVLS
jgi:hypothetical protein